jgi:hypothetical protein
MLIQIDENSATLTPFGSLARKAPANARTEGRSWAKLLRTLAMKTARFAGHHEAREALVLSVAGVTTIMLIANFLLLIFY